MTRAALWLRVSGTTQTVENQRGELEAFCERRGWEVVKTYELDGVSSYHRKDLSFISAAVSDARRGQYDVLVVWALDRLSRGGIQATFSIFQRFHTAGVRVISLREEFTDVPPGPLLDLLFAIIATVANMESQRNSERTKAGIKRAQDEGKHVGRPKGRKDTRKRTRRYVRAPKE